MAAKVAADLYFDIKTDITQLKKGLADAKKETRRASSSIQKSHKKSFDNMRNDVVRYVRQLETVAIALYGMKKIYDVTLGRGHEFNKMMEAEKIGLSLMIVQKLKDVDITGKAVTATEKWAEANRIAAREMESVRKINVETPHTLGQTAQLYKVVRGQILAYGGSMQDASDATRNLSLVGGAANVEFSSMIKTLDQLYQGKMKPSDMTAALQNMIGLRQEDIREAVKQGNVIEFVNTKLKNAAIAANAVKQSWGGVMSNFTNAWDEIASTIQKPLFDKMKAEITSLRDTLTKNKDIIVNTTFEVARSIKQLLPLIGQVAIAFGSVTVAFKVLNSVVATSTIAKVMGAVTLSVLGVVGAYFTLRNENKGLVVGIQDVVDHFQLGWSVIKTGFYGLVEAIGEGINKIYNNWNLLADNMPEVWKGVSNLVKQMWADMINWMIDKLNVLLEGIAGLGNMFGKLFEIEFKPLQIEKIIPDIEPIKQIVAANKKLVDTTWSSTNANKSAIKAWESLGKIQNRTTKEIKKTSKEVKKQTIDFEKIKPTIDDVNKSLKNIKGGGVAKNLADIKKEINDAFNGIADGLELQTIDKYFSDMAKKSADAAKDIADNLSEAFDKGFDAFLSGDIQGAVTSTFKSMAKEAARWAISAVVQANMVGEANALAAIATAAAQTSFYGAAAMAALMAGLGLFSGSIGGAPDISQAQMDQAKGNNTALSDSVTNALEGIEKNGLEGLEYSRRMADSLDMLVSLSDKASANIGDRLSGKDYIPKAQSNVWGGQSREMVSTGIKISPASIKDFETAGLNGYEYLIEKVTKSKYFHMSTKESLSERPLGDLDTSFIDAYTGAFMKGVEGLQQAAEVLGVTSDQFNQFTSEWEMLEQNLNFEGMDAEARTELIVQSLSASLDGVAETLTPLIGYVDQFKKAGEGTSETIFRLANEYEVVGRSMTNLGIALPPVGQGGLVAAESMIALAGGLDKFKAATTTLFNALYSDEEKQSIITQRLTAAFKAQGMALPISKAAMKALYEELTAKKIKLEADIAILKGNIKVTRAEIQLAIIAAKGRTESIKVQIAALRIMQNAVIEMANMLVEIDAKLKVFFDNADDIASYIGSMDDAAGDLGGTVDDLGTSMEDAADAMEQMMLSVSQLKADWMDSLAGAEMMLQMQRNATGLANLTYDNFLSSLQSLTASYGGSANVPQNVYDDWVAMSGALKALRDAVIANTKVNEGGISVAEMRKTWGATGQDEARRKAIEAETGLYDLTVKNFLDKFNEAVEKGFTVEEFDKWQKMSQILTEARDKEMEVLKSQLSFYQNILKDIDNAYTGSLSYLNSMEKAAYAAEAAKRSFEAGDPTGYFDNLRKQLDNEKKMSTTKEDYQEVFDKYIDDLKDAEPEKTTDDVVDELKEMNLRIDDLQDAIERAKY